MNPHDPPLDESFDRVDADLQLTYQEVPQHDVATHGQHDSQYLYDTETDLWYDSVTKEFSRYDPEEEQYFTVLFADEKEEKDGSESIKTSAEMRLVVISSSLLTPGHILIVDEEGLPVGRDRSWDRRLRLPELPVSKFHCQIFYNDNDDADERGFYVTDLGSRNGTFVNNVRLSDPKTSSVPVRLDDLDVITIGSTVFQVHGHRKGWWCDQCRTRADNVIDISQRNGKKVKITPSTMGETRSRAFLDLKPKEQKEVDWMEEIRRRKRSLAPKKGRAAVETVDAAERRRRLYATVPSYLRPAPVPPAAEQHQPESVTDRITIDTPVQGIGNLMLKKMGWEDGQSLGVTGTDGIIAPINPKTQAHRAGLGTQEISTSSPRRTVLQITQERYSELQ
ncbi:hypothetical protein BX666DRAFT_2026682 [Dichotomocladium elegans]|nr:hypothetical protein BX666DRAFT_2026682 [Dichotomocladium elegans]